MAKDGWRGSGMQLWNSVLFALAKLTKKIADFLGNLPLEDTLFPCSQLVALLD